MIITDKNRIDDLVKDLFGSISYRHELSEDDYRVVSRYSKEIKAAFFQLSWFTLEAVFWHYLIKLAISMFLGFFITPVYLVYCLYKIVRLIIKR